MSSLKFSEVSRSTDCPARPERPVTEKIGARVAILGEGMTIRRVLPTRQRRMIGAFCFLDHAGPIEVNGNQGLRVAPHPHTGLQTFSWMIEGEILHRDSLGYEQIIRGGEVNLMTAGRGISHSEETPMGHSGRLQLAQLWIALPKNRAEMEPAFEHYPELPRLHRDGLRVMVLAGEFEGHQAPTRVYTPLIALDLRGEGETTLPLRRDFEHGALMLTGRGEVAGEPIEPGELLYLGMGRDSVDLRLHDDAELLLIGGEPFEEELILFWNFVGRTHEEVEAWVREWNDQGAKSRFGEVLGYDGPRTRSPELTARLRPR